jgi:hypothetical protein
VTGADLDDARAVRESVYRTAKALIEGQSLAAYVASSNGQRSQIRHLVTW